MTQPSRTRSGAASGRRKVSFPSTDQSPWRSCPVPVRMVPLNSMMPVMAHSLIRGRPGRVTDRGPRPAAW